MAATGKKKRSIFAKVKVRPDQLRVVADRRFEDADCLRRTRQNARASGAMYLGGYVIECLLKAKLLERYRWLQSVASPQDRPQAERELWSLCYRKHSLDELLAKLPEVQARLAAVEQRGKQKLLSALKEICARWTVFARYSPHSATISEAKQFLSQVKELKSWLR